jgi:hypothetical protein
MPWFVGDTVTFLGALGDAAGTPLYEADAEPVPALFVAVTVNA